MTTNKTIVISIKRYEELIRKETMYDKITESKDVEFYLMTREENKNNA